MKLSKPVQSKKKYIAVSLEDQIIEVTVKEQEGESKLKLRKIKF